MDISHMDFLQPITARLNYATVDPELARLVGVALDCAILFGAVKGLSGINAANLPPEMLRATWDAKIKQLQFKG